jgi:hypothetical protein
MGSREDVRLINSILQKLHSMLAVSVGRIMDEIVGGAKEKYAAGTHS